MTRHPLLSAFLLALVWCGAPGCRAADAVPANSAEASLAFTGYVVDAAGVLDAADREQLTDRLGRFQRETGHQLAVVTVASLGGEDVAPFTLRLAKRWGVGRKGVDDGIVILVAPNERKARIEIGRGFEQVLPNAFCDAVMTRQMVPAFARGEIGEGVAAGVTAILARIAAAETAQ